MKKVLAAAKLVVGDVAKLEKPALASAVAGVAAPLVAAAAGVDLSAPEVAGWLALAGTVAAAVQNLASGRAAKAAAPSTVNAASASKR